MKFLKTTALTVSKILYKDPGEVPKVVRIDFIVRDFDGVAFATGSSLPNSRTIVFSSRHLINTISSSSTARSVFDEIAGVLTHEMTHVYQSSASYGEPDGFSVIEGIADAVRYLAGFDSITRRSPGGSWTDGYARTGFFIIWLQELKDSDFLYKLNQYVALNSNFSWEAATQELLGQSVQTLWDEYQAAIGTSLLLSESEIDVETYHACLRSWLEFQLQ